MILALLIAIAAWLLAIFLPWWSAFIPGIIFGAILGRSGWTSFAWGAAGIGGLWLIQALYIHFASGGILTSRVANLFSLSTPVLIFIITATIGGLIGGFSTLTGYMLRVVTSGQKEP